MKRSTVKDYRQALDAYLLPAPETPTRGETAYGRARFASTALRELSAREVKGWYDSLPYGRTAEKLLMIVRAIFAHARAGGCIDHDPTAGIERQAVRYSGDYDFYDRDEIDLLVQAADREQDAAVYLTAAMTGLRRGELLALGWRDVDFPGQAIRVRANYSFGQLVTLKSGKVRSVPMVPQVAAKLARLRGREHFTADRDPVFPGASGGHLDASALRRRYAKAAGCRRAAGAPVPLAPALLRLDGRQPRLARPSPIVDGPLPHPTTARYLHAKSQADDAALLATAFSSSSG